MDVGSKSEEDVPGMMGEQGENSLADISEDAETNLRAYSRASSTSSSYG